MLNNIGRFLFCLVVCIVVGFLLVQCGKLVDLDYEDSHPYARGRR